MMEAVMPRRAERNPHHPHGEGFRPDPPRQDPPHAQDAIGFRVVAELRDWHRLWLRCSGCHHAALVDARWLRARRPSDAALARVASRCRCPRCNQLGTPWWRIVADPRNVGPPGPPPAPRPPPPP